MKGAINKLVGQPFVDPYDIVGILVLNLAVDGNIGIGFFHANILINLITGIITIALLIRYRKNLREMVIRKSPT